MARPDLIAQARQGNAAAIAQLITHSLSEQGVVALVSWRGSVLHVSLEADQPLNQAETVPTIRRGFRRLEMTCPLEAIDIESRLVGHTEPSWQERFSLTPGPGSSQPVVAPSPEVITSEPLPEPMAEATATPEPPAASSAPYLTDTTLAALAHLAPLGGYLMVGANWFTGFPFPFFWSGSFLLPWRLVAPLALLLTKGADSPFLKQQAKEALNFQLMMLILWAITIGLMFILVGFLLVPPLALFEVVSTIVAAVRASEAKPFRYPLTVRLVR
jgi:uncharacterized Tic20 family protein